MRRSYFTAVLCAMLAFCFMGLHSASMAEEYSFSPTVMNTEGSLEVGMTTQSIESSQQGTTAKSTGTFLRESLNLAADGYIYHPRFQIFLTRLSGALNEWDVSSNATAGSSPGNYRTTRGSVSYELRTIFLPEHPYNLELFTIHQEPEVPGTLWHGQSTTVDERGVLFSYKAKPYFMHMSYDSESLESTSNRTDTQTYRVNGAYVERHMSHSVAYAHTDSESTGDLNLERETYSYGNAAHLADITLDSNIGKIVIDQRKPASPSTRSSQVSWTEQLYAPLPWNFTSNAAYRFMDETDRITEDPSGLPDQETFNRSVGTSLNLTHHLYQSLVTSFTVNNVDVRSSTGTVTSQSDSFVSTYTKSIPTGRLEASVLYSNSRAVREGTPIIINEAHSAALLGNFSLSQQSIIEGSIQIQVKDPPTGSLMVLQASNYIITTVGTAVQITILGVSPATQQTDLSFIYDFQVSYSLADQSEIDTTSHGFSIKVGLLDNHLTPYYIYADSNQEVISGSIAGGADRTTSETTGLAMAAGPFSGVIEHQSFRSQLTPYEQWKTLANYQASLSEDTTVSVQFTSQQTHYFASDASSGSPAYTDNRTGTDLMMNMRFPNQHMNLFLSGSYYVTRAIVNTDSLFFNSGASWQLGLLSVNAGAQMSRLVSSSGTTETSYITQNYYLTLSRKLF